MTAEELRQYRDQLLRDHALGPLYIPRRFTALPDSGNLSSDLEFRAYGMLREREPTLKEVLTHRSIAIVADPGAGKSVVGRAVVEHLLAHSDRVPIFVRPSALRLVAICSPSENRGNIHLVYEVSTAKLIK
jgi:superfamily II DNA or RNA helicase